MADTGHGWEQIRNEWDFPRLEAWNRHAANYPPIQRMVQAYLGIKPKGTTETAALPDNETGAGELALLMPDTGTLKRPIPEGLCPWRKTT